MNAFITGSQAYGAPDEDSDIDVVLLCDIDTCEMLWSKSEHKEKVAFGKINIIPVVNEDEFILWKKGTETLVMKKEETGQPVSRKVAVQLFNFLGVTGGSG